MEVGRSSPRNQKLALLYPRSSSLQAQINEFFIIAVRFCHEILLFTKKSGFRQFTATLNNDTVKKTQSDLNYWSDEIRNEVDFLIAKRLEEEAGENARFRSISTKFSKSMSEEQKLATRAMILDGCSIYDHETPWKQIRKCGNTSTFAKSDVYKLWKASTISCTLIYLGKLGCGKSVSMANLVDDLNLSLEHDDTPVVYFFVRQDLPDSLKARTIIGSLVRQLLDLSRELVHSKQSGERRLSVEEMLAILLSSYKRLYSKRNRVYVLLDGLDLCTVEETREVVEFMRKIQEHLWVHACVCLRQEPRYEPETVYQGFRSIQISTLPDNRSDITAFVEAELARCVAGGMLKLGDASLILKIQDALLEGSNGMFLWVVLQIKTLCNMETDSDIRAALEDLPVDLFEMYSRILQKVHGKRKTYQGQILRLVTSARQPLNVDEIREALSVVPGHTDWTATNGINDIYSTLATCGCLISIDEEEQTVRFVHPSVRDYLLRPPSDPSQYQPHTEALTMEECHRVMADLIVTYLSYGVFETQLSTHRVPQIDGADATVKVVQSVTGTSKHAQALALRLLANRKQLDFDLGKTLSSLVAHDPPKHDTFIFVHYARRWCLEHICAIGGYDMGPHVQTLLPALIERGDGTTSSLTSTTAVKLAVEHNNEQLLGFLLRSPNRAFLNCRFDYQGPTRTLTYSPLALAVCKGHDKIIRMLKETGEIKSLSVSDYKTSSFPVCNAIYEGDLDSALEADAIIEEGRKTGWEDALCEKWAHVCQSGRNVLACAVWSSNDHTVQTLLDHTWVDGNIGKSRLTPIFEALKGRNQNALHLMSSSEKILLQSGEKNMLASRAKALHFEDAIPLIEAFTDAVFMSDETSQSDARWIRLYLGSPRHHPAPGQLRRRNACFSDEFTTN
jgi:hypothetical protein